MLSGKNQAGTSPTALGSLLQVATYGATIPTIYGMTLSPLLAIWAANIRQGDSGKKLKNFFDKLKGQVGYVENIDFLLGHNPIWGVQQMWNNGSPIPLDFVNVNLGGGHTGHITISDSEFYAVIGVTITQTYNVTFNDYGGNGPVTYTGTYELPLWNELAAGPDPTNNSGWRNWPFVYRWEPSYGAGIYLDYADFDTIPGNLIIYYSKLKAATSFLPPIQKMRLAFENELGNGTEYADAGLSSQQVIYPMFAGLGSSDIDLGTSGAIPQLQAEVQGKFGLYPTGDADFADMIEDVFKSGVAQAAIGATSDGGYTQVEHGLSGYSYPGCIQFKTNASVEAFTQGPQTYNLAVTEGNYLIVLGTTQGSSGGNLSISDTGGNSWTPIFTSPGTPQAWYAVANASGPLTVTVSNLGFGWHVVLMEVGGVDTLDSISYGNGGVASITTTNELGQPGYILSLALYATGPSPNPVIPLWENLTLPNNYGTQAYGFSIQERVVNVPATYSIAIPASGLQFQCLIALKTANPPTYPKPVGDFIDHDSLQLVRLQCRANGLYGSLSMNSQQDASDWLKSLYQAADASPVFAGFKLFSIPLSETSAVGNGAIYTAITSAGPSFNLSADWGDFISNPPITLKSSARVDQPNVLQLQCVNRTSNYNPSLVEQPDAATISLFGIRKADPIVNNAVQDVSVARQLLGIAVRNLQYASDVYTFSMPAKWCLLCPMGAGGGGYQDAVITVSDPLADMNNIPVRISSISEQSDGSLECEATPFVYGMNAPTVFETDVPSPFVPNPSVDVAPVNTPIIFEPVPALVNVQNQGEVWVVVSDPDENYGGAQVYLSTDGGTSYNTAGNPLIGSAITGVNTTDWPAATSPDTTNDLLLNLTESNGVLASYTTTDEDKFLYPCYISGGGASIPYELMTYAVATLTSANHYTLKATSGNHLNRGVYGAPTSGVGVDHPIGSRFAFIAQSGQGILRIPLQPQWIGQTIKFKIVPFNTFGVVSGDLSTATAYSHTVLGTSGAGPGLFQVNGV